MLLQGSMAAVTVTRSFPCVNTSCMSNQADSAQNSCSKTVCSFNIKSDNAIVPLRLSNLRYQSGSHLGIGISHSVNRGSFSIRSSADDVTASNCDNEFDGLYLINVVKGCVKTISEWFFPHPCKPRDKIVVHGDVLTVVRINLTNTQLLTEDGSLVSMSNRFFRTNNFIRYEEPSVQTMQWSIKFNIKDEDRSKEVAHAIQELLAIEDPSADVVFEASESPSFALLAQFSLNYADRKARRHTALNLMVKCHTAILNLGGEEPWIRKIYDSEHPE